MFFFFFFFLVGCGLRAAGDANPDRARAFSRTCSSGLGMQRRPPGIRTVQPQLPSTTSSPTTTRGSPSATGTRCGRLPAFAPSEHPALRTVTASSPPASRPSRTTGHHGPVLLAATALRRPDVGAEPPILPVLLLLRVRPHDALASFLRRLRRASRPGGSGVPRRRGRCVWRVRISGCWREWEDGRAGRTEDGMARCVWDGGV